jgi:glucosamine--fructose-6-phosphate aminotransferase (isomerizing)
VGVVAKYNMEKLLRIPVEACLASEFRYSSPLVNENTLVICISQSGTTADTIAAMREAKRLGARVLSIVNVVGSVIANESDDVLYTWAGPEIAVATTKAYSTQLAVTYLIALYLGELLGTISSEEYDALVSGLQALPAKLEEILNKKEHIQYLASIYFNKEDIFFIGRNIDYALTLESSLKLKEISYIHSEAYAAGELKHGTISLIVDGTLVIASAAYTRLVDKTVSNIVEVKSRGAEILTLTTESGVDAVRHASDNIITIPDLHEVLLPSLAVVPMQLFAYYVALARGCSIDKPRNLAKSVTVE